MENLSLGLNDRKTCACINLSICQIFFVWKKSDETFSFLHPEEKVFHPIEEKSLSSHRTHLTLNNQQSFVQRNMADVVPDVEI